MFVDRSFGRRGKYLWQLGREDAVGAGRLKKYEESGNV
jgi:hypothetical protein